MGTDRPLSLTTSLTVKTRKTLMTLLALLLLTSAFVLAFPQVKASAASNMTRAVRAEGKESAHHGGFCDSGAASGSVAGTDGDRRVGRLALL